MPDRSTDDTMWVKCQYSPTLSGSMRKWHQEETQRFQKLQDDYNAVQKELSEIKNSSKRSCVLM